MKKTFFLLLLTVGFVSCIKKADIKLPEAEKKPVITCFISPQDTVVTAIVAWSTPKFGLNGTSSSVTAGAIKDASVSISDGASNVSFTFNNAFLFYETTGISIKSATTYTLKVIMPGGKTIVASTSVPSAKPNILGIKSRMIRDEKMRIESEMEVTVEDEKNKTNYMALFTKQMVFPLTQEDPFDFFGSFDTDEKIAKNEYRFISGSSFFSSKDTIVSAKIQIDVLNCNREFFLYNKSIQDAGIAAMNPFADPAMVYSNIANGFGCFGAYQREQRSISIR